MGISWFLDEIERRLEAFFHSLKEVESEQARQAQMLDKVASMAGAPRSEAAPAFYIGKASGNITARSGTTPGTGTAEAWDASTGTLTATGATRTVNNAGTIISSGKYIAYQKDPFGVWWAAPLECE